ncbi:hypothetical protein L227DRAFT_618093 [Lentinus tigrinus ALCF2SS1-6]|uniref:Uncharacterized protein n=1 Tax=Lentinus tigrinus ALCF2SS1-6 TaxID=1328759 RepID=A0A5C2RKI3_9APHY|nr:hypothetical protein L227DRAFT_618093 [Lentinus tigrinus ALCF2SS1-6]
MHVDGITGHDLVRARAGTGRANRKTTIHFVTRMTIEPIVYKNLTEAIAHIHNGTYSEFIADATHDSDDTRTTVCDGDSDREVDNIVGNYSDVEQPPAPSQPRNKGKAVNYFQPKPGSPLFILSSSSSDESGSDDSASIFFGSSSKSAKGTRASQRLATKAKSMATATSAKTSKTASSTASKVKPKASSTSRKRRQDSSPEPTQPSRKRTRYTLSGPGTSDEPILVPSDDDWLLGFSATQTKSTASSSSSSIMESLLRKPEGLPTPSKVKNDPWAALNNTAKPSDQN